MNEHREQGWRLLLMPQEATWWIWLITASALAIGLSGYPLAFLGATGLAFAQAIFFLLRDRSLSSPVQTGLAYTLLFTICFIPAFVALLAANHWNFCSRRLLPYGRVSLVPAVESHRENQC